MNKKKNVIEKLIMSNNFLTNKDAMPFKTNSPINFQSDQATSKCHNAPNTLSIMHCPAFATYIKQGSNFHNSFETRPISMGRIRANHTQIWYTPPIVIINNPIHYIMDYLPHNPIQKCWSWSKSTHFKKNLCLYVKLYQFIKCYYLLIILSYKKELFYLLKTFYFLSIFSL